MVKSISSSEITKAIPCMMPLDLVRQVTREFATTLRQQDLKLRCFWDGPARSFKANTSAKREMQHQQEWAMLQTFCRHGTLPMKPTQKVCGCIRQFPLPRLFILSVEQTLRTCSIDMVHCDEEADAVLAMEASGNPDSFVLGQDSDFLFYKDIQYIPLTCIYMPSSPSLRVQAVCLTRKSVADAIGLDDEDMIELAILLGNDYVDPKELDVPTADLKTVMDRVTYLQQRRDTQVQAKDKSTQVLEYVRALYDLHPDTESFLENDKSNDSSDDISDIRDPIEALDDCVISFPSDFPWEQAVVLPTDSSFKDAIIRCLQFYVDQFTSENTGESCVLRDAHIAAYKKVTESPFTSTTLQLTKRPKWENVCAAFIIDGCIARALRAPGNFLLAKQIPSDVLMNHIHFHAMLDTLQDNEHEEATDAIEASGSFPQTVERTVLPIDEHQETILNTIQANQVTIIHGETGCGKSSRVPVMILEAPSPEPSLPKIKMFISQPRRIAAASLVERVRSCEPTHRNKFALRMGHGHREYESRHTQAWFVTTGYLTRLLANHPERFNDVTHLIIDEVHERSVDTDILCLLCRRLLESNKKIRLVLMSATMATKLYKEYFKVQNEPIHVGVRRFPITQYFVEDLHQKFKLPPNEQKAAQTIQKECESKKCNSSPSSAEIATRFSLAARLTTIVGTPGSSVLIFVPGIGEIIAITEAIESFYRPGVTYKCYPIHSEVPFEEQMGAFDPPGSDEVKVIVATNAAESSVTLPAVDHVICLGLCRQIMYNEASHRQILLSCWISRASATQRAGRTGRLRPGNVYRLYTRTAYEKYMDEFEEGEMVRIPLDSVILMLKEMLHEQAKPVLLDCLEPPRMETIDKSFQSLYDWKFLSEPSDSGEITNLGSFVSALGIDLALGSFVGLGIQFGVAAEAIEMASIMSFPKSPFQISNLLIHDAAVFNKTISEVYVAKCHFDTNLYSEPLALMNALWDYHVAPDKARWCQFYRISQPRIRQLFTTRNSLRKRVADFLGINEDKLQLTSPPVHMPHYKITILRVLKVWVFSDAIIESRPPKVTRSPDGKVSVSLPRNQKILEQHLSQVLSKDRHPYQIIENHSIERRGEFEVTGGDFSLGKSIDDLQLRLVSFLSETGMDMALLEEDGLCFVVINEEKAAKTTVSKLLDLCSDTGESLRLEAVLDTEKNRRGILGRKCGLWKVSSASKKTKTTPYHNGGSTRHYFRRLCSNSDDACVQNLAFQALNSNEIASILHLRFLKATKRGKKKKKSVSQQEFQLLLRGSCQPMSKVDIQDLLGALFVNIAKDSTKTVQSINFMCQEKMPWRFNKKGAELMATSIDSDLSAWKRPLFIDTPEGARILSVLASGNRRGEPRVEFSGETDDEEEKPTTIFFDPVEMSIAKRWYRFGSDQMVFVDTTTVPASATNADFPLIACCSNSLQLKGGGLKVEGMTILPPNPLFLLLCRLSFGLRPDIDMNFRSLAGDKSGASSDPTKQALAWLKTRLENIDNKTIETGIPGVSFDLQSNARSRIQMAIEFHQSCVTMGETLVCFPEKVRTLCQLFTGLDGYDSSPCEAIQERGVTLSNLTSWQSEKRKQTVGRRLVGSSKGSTSELRPDTMDKSSSRISTPAPPIQSSSPPVEGEVNTSKGKFLAKWRILRTFDKVTQEKARSLFATTFDGGQQLSPSDFPSTNILAIIFQEVAIALSRANEKNKQIAEKGSVTLDTTNWEIVVHEHENSTLLYRAKFKNGLIPMTPLLGRGKNKLPKWMKKDSRPKTVHDMKACVPPTIPFPEPKVVHLSKDRQALAFDTIDCALQMEAAFYLERQFAVAGKNTFRHWFDHGLTEMVNILLKSIHA